MKKFEVHIAYEVTAHKVIEVEAETKREAIEKAINQEDDCDPEIDWSSADTDRVVGISKPVNKDFEFLDIELDWVKETLQFALPEGFEISD